ncbi:MAG: hypothetical protein AAGI38_14980 [Bacteroidota bacterium]
MAPWLEAIEAGIMLVKWKNQAVNQVLCKDKFACKLFGAPATRVSATE